LFLHFFSIVLEKMMIKAAFTSCPVGLASRWGLFFALRAQAVRSTETREAPRAACAASVKSFCELFTKSA